MALNNVGATIGGVSKNLVVAVDVNGNIAAAHTTVDQNGVAIIVAQDGTDATGVTAPLGAVGIRGWLSGIFAGIGTPGDAIGAVTVVGQLRSLVNTFKTAIGVSIGGSLPAGTNLIGSVTLSASGIGALTAIPAGTANGTVLDASPPTGKRGARLYMPPGASVSYTIASTQPTSAPLTITVANPSASTMPANWDEDLAGAQMIYVTATVGAPLFRWY